MRGKLGLPIELRSRQTNLRIRRRSAYARSHRHLMPRCRRDVLPVKHLRPQIPLQHRVKRFPRLIILRGADVARMLYFELPMNHDGVSRITHRTSDIESRPQRSSRLSVSGQESRSMETQFDTGLPAMREYTGIAILVFPPACVPQNWRSSRETVPPASSVHRVRGNWSPDPSETRISPRTLDPARIGYYSSDPEPVSLKRFRRLLTTCSSGCWTAHKTDWHATPASNMPDMIDAE